VIDKAAIRTVVIGVARLFGLAASGCKSSRAADARVPLPAAGAADAADPSKDAATDAITDASTRHAANGGAGSSPPARPCEGATDPINFSACTAPPSACKPPGFACCRCEMSLRCPSPSVWVCIDSSPGCPAEPPPIGSACTLESQRSDATQDSGVGRPAAPIYNGCQSSVHPAGNRNALSRARYL
jgi:hypothetical protein